MMNTSEVSLMRRTKMNPMRSRAESRRFHQFAPLGFSAGDENLYRIEGNDVTSAVDPSGMDSWKDVPVPVEVSDSLKNLVGSSKPGSDALDKDINAVQVWQQTQKALNDLINAGTFPKGTKLEIKVLHPKTKLGEIIDRSTLEVQKGRTVQVGKQKIQVCKAKLKDKAGSTISVGRVTNATNEDQKYICHSHSLGEAGPQYTGDDPLYINQIDAQAIFASEEFFTPVDVSKAQVGDIIAIYAVPPNNGAPFLLHSFPITEVKPK
jgi:hypothetical protein